MDSQTHNELTDAQWTLDLRDPKSSSVSSGPPLEGQSPDLVLTISDANFAKLVAGKLGPQQVCIQEAISDMSFCHDHESVAQLQDHSSVTLHQTT